MNVKKRLQRLRNKRKPNWMSKDDDNCEEEKNVGKDGIKEKMINRRWHCNVDGLNYSNNRLQIYTCGCYKLTTWWHIMKSNVGMTDLLSWFYTDYNSKLLHIMFRYCFDSIKIFLCAPIWLHSDDKHVKASGRD